MTGSTEHLLPIEKLLTQPPNTAKFNGWLLPYLDVFTLLAMIFVVLLSLAGQQLQDNQQSMSQQQLRMNALQNELEPLRQMNLEGRSALQLEHFQEQIDQRLESLKLRDDVALQLEDEFVSLQISEQWLFGSGSAALSTEGQQMLERLLPVFDLAAGTILVEGHTDDQPIGTSQYPSNWELGAARASSVVKYLAGRGMPRNRLRAMSFADSKPIAENTTEAGRSQNRRVALLLRMPDPIE